MVEGWQRVCPTCGNSDGAKVERIAIHPTFQCECGYVWDGSKARFVGMWAVGEDETDHELKTIGDEIFGAKFGSGTN